MLWPANKQQRMESDLEEGEVPDSENEGDEGGQNKTAFPQPVAAASVNSFPWRTESSCPISSATVTATEPLQLLVLRQRRDSCDSASSGSDAKDSDSDEAPFAKKRCPTGRSHVSTANLPAAATRPPSKYNIWGSVIQEQTLAKDLGGWFGMNTKVDSDRDVETYDYRKAKESGAGNETDSTEMVEVATIADDAELQPTNEDENADICDRETFGMGSGAKTSKGNRSGGTRKRRRDDEVRARQQRPPIEADPNRGCAKSRLSKRSYDKEKDRSHVCVGAGDPPVAVGEELVRILGEPDHMKDTFVRVAETLGPEKALQLLYCTEDLEEAGGLMTLNGSRRRTPGGVYLFLVKEDANLARDQHDIIFYGSVEERRRQQRETKQRHWRFHHNKIAASKQFQPRGNEVRPLPDRRDLFLKDAVPNGDGDPSVVGDSCDMAAVAENSDKLDEDVDDCDILDIELDLV